MPSAMIPWIPCQLRSCLGGFSWGLALTTSSSASESGLPAALGGASGGGFLAAALVGSTDGATGGTFAALVGASGCWLIEAMGNVAELPGQKVNPPTNLMLARFVGRA